MTRQGIAIIAVFGVFQREFGGRGFGLPLGPESHGFTQDLVVRAMLDLILWRVSIIRGEGAASCGGYGTISTGFRLG
jgi:hypothetical protein